LAATDFSWSIAEKELFRSLMERETLDADEDAEPDAVADEAALVLELLELLQPAATSSAAAAATAVSPARRTDTEYNGVPRSFTQTCRERHVRDQIRITRSQMPGLSAEMLGLCGETFPLTLL
jgi:hypothetical protein